MSQSTTPAAAPIVTWYRWFILFVCFLTFLISFVDRLTWANVAAPVSGSLGLPVAALGIFVTAFYVGYVVCNALGGLASDYVGGRITLTASMLALGCCTFAFSWTNSITMGLVIQALMGLSAGADYASCIKVIVSWFARQDRGKAMGLFFIASSLGVAATNAIVPSLVAAIGWQDVYRVLGAATLAVGLLTFLTLRDGPLGAVPTSRLGVGLGALLRDPTMMLITVAGFGGLWGTWGFAFWANALMVKQRGLSAVEAGVVVSLVGLAAMVGKPLFGWLSDRMGGRPKWLIVGCFLLFAVMLLVFGTLTDRLSFQLAAPLLGLGAFVYSPLLAVLVAERAGPALAGSATGVISAVWQMGVVIVPLMVGLVFQTTGSFLAAFSILAAGPLIGAVCMLLVPDGKPDSEPDPTVAPARIQISRPALVLE